MAAIRRRIADLQSRISTLTAEVADLREKNERLMEAAGYGPARPRPVKATPGPKR